MMENTLDICRVFLSSVILMCSFTLKEWENDLLYSFHENKFLSQMYALMCTFRLRYCENDIFHSLLYKLFNPNPVWLIWGHRQSAMEWEKAASSQTWPCLKHFDTCGLFSIKKSNLSDMKKLFLQNSTNVKNLST
jgi:hypothetical protein